MKYFTLLFFTFFSAKNVYAIQCPEGHFPVRAFPRNAYTKTDGTQVSAANVKEQCRPYRVFKAPEPKFISTVPKNWPNSKEKFRAWTKEEEAKIHDILSKLPKSLTHIGEIKFLRSTEKSPNPAVSNSSNQIIVLYDSVTSHDLTRVISHELAHIFWDSADEFHENFLNTAEWIVSKDKKTISLKRKNIPIPDSYTGPDEDFSNSVELFIHDKNIFKDQPVLLKCLEDLLK